MRLQNYISAPAQDERSVGDDEQADRSGGGLREQLRSGRFAIGTGVLWILRGIRSPRKRRRRLILGALALGVGLYQRRSQQDGGSPIPDDLTGSDAKRGVADESGMTEVELEDTGTDTDADTHTDADTEEPPEDIQTDMEASGEITDENEGKMAQDQATDVGAAPEGEETGIDLGTDETAEGGDTEFGGETEEVGADETADADAESDEGMDGEATTDEDDEEETTDDWDRKNDDEE